MTSFKDIIDANIRPKDAPHKFIIRVITTGGIIEGILTEVDEVSITLQEPIFPGLENNKQFKHLILDKNQITGYCYATDMDI